MVENLQREDLNAVDKASAFREYLSRYGGTQEELAGRLGVDRSTVSNLIRLLDLPPDVLDAVRAQRDHPGPRSRASGPSRRREPVGRLQANHRRTPLGPPDRGTRHHRNPDPLAHQGPKRPRSRDRGQGPPFSRSRTTVPSLPGHRGPDPAPESRSRPDHHRLPDARRARSPRHPARSGGCRLIARLKPVARHSTPGAAPSYDSGREGQGITVPRDVAPSRAPGDRPPGIAMRKTARTHRKTPGSGLWRVHPD